MNKEALLRLADKLEGVGPYKNKGPVPIHRFNMNWWCEDELVESKAKYNEKAKAVVAGLNLSCGSSACAAGWAGSDPWFRDRGFYTTLNGVTYKGHSDFDACEVFFDISRYETSVLFAGEEDEDPEDKAKEIRDFVNKKNREYNPLTGV